MKISCVCFHSMPSISFLKREKRVNHAVWLKFVGNCYTIVSGIQVVRESQLWIRKMLLELRRDTTVREIQKVTIYYIRWN